jgi:hypothetical protein
MPDITKCEGYDCPWKSKCWRFRSKPYEQYQAYYAEPPYKKVDEVIACEAFWPMDEKDRYYSDTMD